MHVPPTVRVAWSVKRLKVHVSSLRQAQFNTMKADIRSSTSIGLKAETKKKSGSEYGHV